MKKLSFNTLNELNDQLLHNFPNIIKYFDLDLQEFENMYTGCCPLHANADNPTAFTLYKNTGLWRCHTHGCEKVFRSTIIGLIRGLLSKHNHNWTDLYSKSINSFPDTLEFIKEFCEKLPKEAAFSNKRNVPVIKRATPKETRFPIRKFVQHIQCPAKYYVNRGFCPKILEEYKVGFYWAPGKEMHNRVLVPIFDNNKEYVIGCTGRTPYEKCIVCEGYHKDGTLCVDKKQQPWMFQKWKHNKGFIKTEYLYNHWDAEEFAKYKNELILVEGPSEVWKLEEAGIHNSMAIFGCKPSITQKDKIRKLGIESLKIIVDNDNAGHMVYADLADSFSDLKVEKIIPPLNDLGDLTIEQIKELTT